MNRLAFLFLLFSIGSNHAMFRGAFHNPFTTLKKFFSRSTSLQKQESLPDQISLAAQTYDEYVESRAKLRQQSPTYATFSALNTPTPTPTIFDKIKALTGHTKSNFFPSSLEEELESGLTTITSKSDYFPLYFSPAETKEIASIIAQIIKTEAQHPEYQSFFHAANGHLAIFYDLLKRTYSQSAHTEFEFLRPQKGREGIKNVRKERYFLREQPIVDSIEPFRSELLSVAYVPWLGHTLGLFTRNYSVFSVKLEKWLKDASIPIKDDTIPRIINHGLLLHILIKKDLVSRIVYNAVPGGAPDHEELPTAPYKKTIGQARIILDPTVFDTPTEDVKIFRYHPLSPAEIEAKKTFCDKIERRTQKQKMQRVDFFTKIFFEHYA